MVSAPFFVDNYDAYLQLMHCTIDVRNHSQSSSFVDERESNGKNTRLECGIKVRIECAE